MHYRTLETGVKDFRKELALLEKMDSERLCFYRIQMEFMPKDKLKYYKQYIENQAIILLNELDDAIIQASCQVERKEKLNSFISDILFPDLARVRNYIISYKLKCHMFKGVKEDISQLPHPMADEAFLAFYLKHQLVRLYLEVTRKYPELCEPDMPSEDEIYSNYFFHMSPGVIIENENLIYKPLKKKPTVNVSFTAIKGDLPNSIPKGLSYSDLVRDPNRFARAEEQLFDHGYINEMYQFTGSWGSKKDFMLIMYILIQNNYFYDRKFPENVEIKNYEIRRFFEERYHVDLRRTIRKNSVNQKEIDDFREQHYWLHNLPGCSKSIIKPEGMLL